MARPRPSRRRPTLALLAATAALAAGGCGGEAAGGGEGTISEAVVTTPTPALVARAETLAACLAAADLGGLPAQLTPIDLRAAAVGVTITGLPVGDGGRADGGGIVWLFEDEDAAEGSIAQVTAPGPGEREQYIDGAAIVILYEGADDEAVAVLERCVGRVSDPAPDGAEAQAPGKADAPPGATATVPAGSPPSSA
ncbi:MAG: hypothetical protein RIB67_02805 [Miltoncostaeaceae bacterium]